MNKKVVWLVVAAIVVVLLLSVVGSYNGIVSQKEGVNASFKNIDAQLQRRLDLIPNLVNTVKGFAAQEKSIFDSVSQARAKLAGATTVGDKADANAQLSNSLSRLLAIAENYPTLKSDANFRQLADELAGTENRIAVARLDYNKAVQTYNARIKRFPMVLFAGMFGFTPAQYFTASQDAQQVPTVTFGT